MPCTILVNLHRFTFDILNMFLYPIYFHPTRWFDQTRRRKHFTLISNPIHLPFDWENRPVPLPTPTVLHPLIKLHFNGLIKYLDDFMARIDAPLLYHLDIAIRADHYQAIVFNTSHIPRFIGHIHEFQALDEAHFGINCYESVAWIKIVSIQTTRVVLKLDIICDNLGRQFSSLAQFCRSPAFPLAILEYLCFSGGEYMQCWHRDIENIQWTKLLHPFTSVKYLYLSKDFAQCIATAWNNLVEKY